MAKKAAKTAVKTAPPSPLTGYALPVGNHPGNTGGKKGRSGRLPSTFAGFVRSLHDKTEIRTAITKAASDPESRGFSPVLKLLAEYDPERPAPPTQPVAAEVVIRVVRDGIAPVAVAAGAALALPPGEPVVVVTRDGAA